MRRHLIDLARGRPIAQFNGLEKLEAFLPASSAKVNFAIMVDRSWTAAEGRAGVVHLVGLKYFLGLTDEEAAEVLGVKMQRMWRDARQWLFEQTESGHAGYNTG